MSRTTIFTTIVTTWLAVWPATYALAGTATPSNVSVSIEPGPATLAAGQSAQFTAKVVGATNTAVKWSVTPNLGSLLNGLYTAPADIISPQTVALTVASAADPTKSAAVSLIVGPIRQTVRRRGWLSAMPTEAGSE